MPRRNRDEFRASIVATLAKRSGYLCAICRAVTIGPSAESPLSVTNLGVASHITAAAPGGRRYDPSLTPQQRRAIGNGIWLCQIDAKRIDADDITYTAEALRQIKARHEAFVMGIAGVPPNLPNQLPNQTAGILRGMTVQEYAFMRPRDAGPAYLSVLTPILNDRSLQNNDEIGVLMCTGPTHGKETGVEWTAFVDAGWLHWFLRGQNAGFRAARTVAPTHILGCIPAWPDGFFDWLAAIVETGTTFTWQRHSDGYLVLAQP